MYVMQFLFTGPATGYVLLAFFNLLTGLYCIGVKRRFDVDGRVFIVRLPSQCSCFVSHQSWPKILHFTLSAWLHEICEVLSYYFWNILAIV